MMAWTPTESADPANIPSTAEKAGDETRKLSPAIEHDQLCTCGHPLSAHCNYTPFNERVQKNRGYCADSMCQCSAFTPEESGLSAEYKHGTQCENGAELTVGGSSAPQDHLWTDEHLGNCPSCYQQYWRGRD